jgi:hypothetical protein
MNKNPQLPIQVVKKLRFSPKYVEQELAVRGSKGNAFRE